MRELWPVIKCAEGTVFVKELIRTPSNYGSMSLQETYTRGHLVARV